LGQAAAADLGEKIYPLLLCIVVVVVVVVEVTLT
jgi:hypothetical protein